MLIAGVLCLAAAVLVAAAGLRAVSRPAGGDPRSQAVRMLAPTQFAAAAMLAAGGVVALNSGLRGLPLVLLAIVAAVATVAAGAWQGGRYAVEQAEAAPVGCAGSCTSCTRTCS